MTFAASMNREPSPAPLSASVSCNDLCTNCAPVPSVSLTKECKEGQADSLLTCGDCRYGYSTTHRKPSWVELNMMNIVVQPIKEEAAAAKVLEAPDGWVIMHADFGRDQAS